MCAGARTFGARTCGNLAGVRGCKDVWRARCAETCRASASAGTFGAQGAQKLAGCQRVQGPPPLSLRGAKRRDNPFSLRQSMTGSSTLGESEKRDKFAWRHVVALRTPAMFQHVIARSEATWQSASPAAGQNEKQLFPANTQLLRICPKNCQFAKFLCGDADCRTSVRTGSQ